MKLYVVDAFTTQRFSGNQAGVALLEAGEDYPGEDFMRALAAELKHSETAFVRRLDGGRFQVRYFTPEGEVALCGHATIAAFTTLREEKILAPGIYIASTLAGELAIQVEASGIWMDMAPPRVVRGFDAAENAELYAAYGLTCGDCAGGYVPKAVSTGLTDILLPVKSLDALDRATQNEAEVTRLSQKYEVVGVHMFCPTLTAEATCHVRNFAPLYAIPEESATGTANGALTYYLYEYGRIKAGDENIFVQGERMGKPSMIRSRLFETDGAAAIKIGGGAVIVLRCHLEHR